MLELLAPAAVAGALAVLILRRWWERDAHGWVSAGDDASVSATSLTFRSPNKHRSRMSHAAYLGYGGVWGVDGGADGGCGGDGGGGGGD